MDDEENYSAANKAVRQVGTVIALGAYTVLGHVPLTFLPRTRGGHSPFGSRMPFTALF